MAVRILTDSTSDINEKTIKKLGIDIMSLNVISKKKNMKEIDIDNTTFYSKLEDDDIPSSSQPSIGKMHEVFKDILSSGDELICVFLSSELSGTYSTANMVKDNVIAEIPDAKIAIIDSKSTSMQLGVAAIVGARAANAGGTFEEVQKLVKDNIKRSRFLFLPDNLDYLEKGGRIGGASALLGNLLQIIPILTVIEGKAEVFRKVRTKRKAVSKMLDKVVDDANKYGLEGIYVHHINALDEAQQLAKKVEGKLGVLPAIEDIGPVVGIHVGPGAIGIVYYTKEPLR